MENGNGIVGALFAAKDALHFAGALGRKRWTASLAALSPDTLGEANNNRREILINRDLSDSPQKLLEILLHEMAHAHLFVTGDPSHARRNNSHGAAFLRELQRLTAAGEPLQTEVDLYANVVDENQTEIAAHEYIARQSRNIHPPGKFDSSGRWFPSRQETADCCDRVRSPTRAYPYSLQLHCRTILHVSQLFDVDTISLRSAVKRLQRQASNVHEETRATDLCA